MEQASGHRWAARAVLILMTLLGLVGMHGLPDAMASSSGATTMPAGAAMSPSLTPTMNMTVATRQSAPPRRAYHADPVARRPAHLLRNDARLSALGLAAPAGCGMDHANCVAVLTELGHLSGSGPTLSVAAGSGMPMPPLPVWTPARGPRAPPDVSLIGLGISRT